MTSFAVSSFPACTDFHVAEPRYELDIPDGRCAGHAPTAVRWVAPRNLVVNIRGGVWKLRESAPADVTVWVKNVKIIEKVAIRGTSKKPLDFTDCAHASQRDPGSLLKIALNAGEAVVIELGGNDYVGLDLGIDAGNQSWDLARDFSYEHNPNGPWTYGQFTQTGGDVPDVRPYDTVEPNFDVERKSLFGPQQPAWRGSSLAPHLSLLRGHGGVRAMEQEVTYSAGNTCYVEALEQNRWISRFWGTEGRLNLKYERWSVNAFQLDLDGKSLDVGWQFTSAHETSHTALGPRHVIVSLANGNRPVRLELHTLLDDTEVMTRWLEVQNIGNKPIAITAIYPWTNQIAARAKYYADPLPGTPAEPFTLGYFSRLDHCWEGWFKWKPLPSGITELGCDRGQCYDDPFFIVRGEQTGQYLIGSLAWSANWRMELNCLKGNLNQLQFKIGPSAKEALRVIAPGETVQSPAVHMALTTGDLDQVTQQMRDHVRKCVLPRRPENRSWLIQYALPGDQGYLSTNFGNASGCTEENVFKNIDIAKELGAELFIMDAGWWDEQGDWEASRSRFPHGMRAIARRVHERNMLFGLYGEIERASSKECRVAREHPDWIDWYPNFGILDLSNPLALNHAETELTRMIREYELDLFRLDYNAPMKEACEGAPALREGINENRFWRYYDAFDGMFSRVHEIFPSLILQQAACGGGRNDLGTVRRFHEQYLTDGLRLPYVLQNFSGQTLSLPPECLTIALGADGGTGIGQGENVETNLRVTFTLGTPWIFAGRIGPELSTVSPEMRNRYHHYVNLYKDFIRPILPTSRTFHHAPVNWREGVESSGWFAIEFAAPDCTRGWATIVRIGATDSDTYRFIPRGLDIGKRYQVTFDGAGQQVKLTGLELMRDGLRVRLESMMASELILFETN